MSLSPDSSLYQVPAPPAPSFQAVLPKRLMPWKISIRAASLSLRQCSATGNRLPIIQPPVTATASESRRQHRSAPSPRNAPSVVKIARAQGATQFDEGRCARILVT